MFLKIDTDQYIEWDKVVLVSFKRESDKLVAAELEWEGGGVSILKEEYVNAVWNRMFPTKKNQ